MKKVMIALAAVALAGAAQAATSVQVKQNSSNLFYDGFNAKKDGTSNNLLSGYTIYFINGWEGNGGVDYLTLLRNLRAGVSLTTAIGSASFGSATITDGNVGDTTISVENSALRSGDHIFYYTAILANGGEDVFLSAARTLSVYEYEGGDLTGYTLYANGEGSNLRLDDDATVEHGNNYSGWYSLVTPIPEPTSGLLMLIGMAGLALRRKRG